MATSNNEWLQNFQNNLTTGWSGDVATDATTVTTATTASSSVGNQLGPVIRPNNTRRRSRASRKTPTTILNTDTTNFRAMVQQFTGGGGGGGSGAFVSAPTTLHSYNTDSSGFGYYGTGSRITQPASGAYNVEIRQPQGQQYYTIVADCASGDHQQQGFVQRIQEGDMANFSGENTNGGNNFTCMF